MGTRVIHAEAWYREAGMEEEFRHLLETFKRSGDESLLDQLISMETRMKSDQLHQELHSALVDHAVGRLVNELPEGWSVRSAVPGRRWKPNFDFYLQFEDDRARLQADVKMSWNSYNWGAQVVDAQEWANVMGDDNRRSWHRQWQNRRFRVGQAYYWHLDILINAAKDGYKK